MMDYKGYIGKVVIDDEAGILSGEVINIRDVITFEGTSVDEIHKAFRESVDDYLEFCAQRGEAPEKPFSGNIHLRLKPDLHAKLAIEAKLQGVSLNNYINSTLQRSIDCTT